jgi:hypothetical protein
MGKDLKEQSVEVDYALRCVADIGAERETQYILLSLDYIRLRWLKLTYKGGRVKK